MSGLKLIGLSGYARTGKDTVAGILEDRGFRRGSFAAKLKEALLALDPYVYIAEGAEPLSYVIERMGWESAKDLVPEVRPLLQRMGTEVGRGFFGEDVWVELALESIGVGERVVFSDCRFPNEADGIRALGGQIWRVQRPGYAPANAHPSEVSLDTYDFDRVITNDGTRAELWAQVNRALRPVPEPA